MRVLTWPSVPLDVLRDEMDFVIEAHEDLPPEIHLSDGGPRPDRHVLLGLAEAAALAVDEKDPDLVGFTKEAKVELVRNGRTVTVEPVIMVFRSIPGRLGILAVGDPARVRRVVRQMRRYFTRMIRLDVP
ncbi:MAG: hypothetical protein AB1646_26210 [Thermodesulfobacteriota bacterium]